MPKRLINECKTCGYTWYPRGRSVSVVCPRCKAQSVGISGNNFIGLMVVGVVGVFALVASISMSLAIIIALAGIGIVLFAMVTRGGDDTGGVSLYHTSSEPPAKPVNAEATPSSAWARSWPWIVGVVFVLLMCGGLYWAG